MEISHAQGAPFAINSMFDRVIHPLGRNGGSSGKTGRPLPEIRARTWVRDAKVFLLEIE